MQHQVTKTSDGEVASSVQIKGYEAEHCIITNATGLNLPIRWTPVRDVRSVTTIPAASIYCVKQCSC